MTMAAHDRASRFVPLVILDRFTTLCVAAANDIQQRRDVRKSLGRLSDEDLQDIGLIRSDIDVAYSTKSIEDVAVELDIAARRRSGNW